ncbi:MAG: tRNA (adenosine(37)-N6)-threonylcarbamoyltransferase complex ATPase subunit type 1 TsaE [Calditrichaeota bacterium]|nr:tRNA (adenosine(37)-N6)-threonylcarbamoyltransferase complex ATPase subunit type 1 TsaE [Calditrichota bacterium]
MNQGICTSEIERGFTRSRQETIDFGKTLAARLEPGSILALVGPLGAGKTTLIQGIGAGLGVSEAITSPAFNYLFEYSGRLPLFHADLYRIEDSRQFLALGLDEYFDRDGVLAIEWAERIADILPSSTTTIYLRPGSEGDSREIIVCQGPPHVST